MLTQRVVEIHEYVGEKGDSFFAKWIDTLNVTAVRPHPGTMGFEKRGGLTGKPPKSLTRMLGPRSNPQARNLFAVIGHLQQAEGLRLSVSLRH